MAGSYTSFAYIVLKSFPFDNSPQIGFFLPPKGEEANTLAMV